MKLNELDIEEISEPGAGVSSANRWNENALGTHPVVGSPPTSEREIHGPDGEVIKIYGTCWHDAVNLSDPDESVLVVAPTREWVHQIKCDLANAFPGIPFVDLRCDRSAKKRIGTIGDAKEHEADTVILFMCVPDSAYRVISDPAVRNDVLRMFYVGATRSRTKLVEVYDYLRYRDGTYAPAPLDIIT